MVKTADNTGISPAQAVEQTLSRRDASELTSAQRKKITSITKEVDLTDAESVSLFGVGVQKNITEFAGGILERVSAEDAGQVGELLTGLVGQIKSVNVESLDGKPGFLSRLFGGLFSRASRIFSRYNQASKQIDRIVALLDTRKQELIHELRVLDDLFDRNLEYFENLNCYILAGEDILDEVKNTRLKELEDKAKETGELIDLQKLKDFRLLIERFEKRLHDIRLTRTITLQTIPQIRIIQSGNHELIGKIQSSILNTIPLWKNQIVLAVSLHRQKQSLAMQKAITDTTNEILSRNSELIKDNTVAIATESQRGIVDLATLKKTNGDLIFAINEAIRIQNEGRTRRQQIEKELKGLEKDMVKTLKQVKARSVDGEGLVKG